MHEAGSLEGEWCGETPHRYVRVTSEQGWGALEGSSKHKIVSRHIVRIGEVLKRDSSGPASVSSHNEVSKHIVRDSRLGGGGIGLEAFSTCKDVSKRIVHIGGMLDRDTGGTV